MSLAATPRQFGRCATMSYALEAADVHLDHSPGPDAREGARPHRQEDGAHESEIAREALRRQVAVARFRELRRKTLPFAEAQGLLTDGDVLKSLS